MALNDPAVAGAYLDRIAVEEQLLADIGDLDNDDLRETLTELVSFAATALELWAAHTSDSAPEGLLQQIAKRW